MKKIQLTLFLIFTMLFTQVGVYAKTDFNIQVPDYTFTIGEETLSDLPVFNINDEYYLPITVMAEFFGFHTEIDKNKPYVIQLVEGNRTYTDTKEQNLFEFVQNTNRKAELSKYKVCYKEKDMQTSLLTIDGYNFVKLKDAADFFGIYIYTDNKNKTVDFSLKKDIFREMDESEKRVYQQYLEENVMPIDINNLETQELIKDGGLDQYPIILFGEHHAMAKTFDIELFFIKYLNKNENRRHIFIENGYCDAQLLNRYLKTGDSSILENMMNRLEGTFAYSMQTYQFYKAIYEYNQSLPKDKKLEFIGVDVQHQTNTGIDYIVSLLPKTQIPEPIKEDIEALLLAQKEKTYNSETVVSLLKNLEENKEIYKQYLGAEYEHFKLGLTSINQLFECEEVPEEEFMDVREKKMIENFTYQYNKINTAKCFGIFGGAHTYLNAYFDSDNKDCNMATYINAKHDQTKGKVASMEAVYFRSYYMNRKTGESLKVYDETLQKMLAHTTTSDYALFPLDRAGSIFVKDGSTKSLQYLLLIKNSPAATRYHKK